MRKIVAFLAIFFVSLPAFAQNVPIHSMTNGTPALTGDLVHIARNVAGTWTDYYLSVSDYATFAGANLTAVNKVTLTAPASGSTLTIANGKTLTASNTLTLTGTDSSSIAFGTGGTVAYTGNNLSSFASTSSSQLRSVLSDESGTGAALFAGGNIGAATATSLNGLAVTSSTGTLAITNAKTFSVNNTLTLSGTDGSTLNVGTGGTLGTAAYTSSSAYEVPLTISTGLSRSTNTISSNAVYQISFQPGLLTSVTGNKSVYSKVSKNSTVDNIEGSALLLSCVSNPTVTFYECGTSSTCSSTPTTIGSVTVTTTGTVVDGTVSNAAITAGDYIAWAITAGTCTSLDISVAAQVHSN